MALIPMAIAFRLIYFLVSFLNERTVSYDAESDTQYGSSWKWLNIVNPGS
jgi:hypothetical protein